MVTRRKDGKVLRKGYGKHFDMKALRSRISMYGQTPTYSPVQCTLTLMTRSSYEAVQILPPHSCCAATNAKFCRRNFHRTLFPRTTTEGLRVYGIQEQSCMLFSKGNWTLGKQEQFASKALLGKQEVELMGFFFCFC